mmetsp:Transcript_44778/g.52489  ORF Transcript_44778/g.52489 Transcript_44778/m.52489 type:complete len:240 (-) Transcript_44778:182-901(-)
MARLKRELNSNLIIRAGSNNGPETPNWTKKRKRNEARSNVTSQADNMHFREGVDGNNKFHIIKDEVSQGRRENRDENPSHNQKRMLSRRSLIFSKNADCSIYSSCDSISLSSPSKQVECSLLCQDPERQSCKSANDKSVSHVPSRNEIKAQTSLKISRSLAITEQHKQKNIVENHPRTGSKATTTHKAWTPRKSSRTKKFSRLVTLAPTKNKREDVFADGTLSANIGKGLECRRRLVFD